MYLSKAEVFEVYNRAITIISTLQYSLIMEQLFCIPVQVAHHIAISDKLAAQKGAIFLP